MFFWKRHSQFAKELGTGVIDKVVSSGYRYRIYFRGSWWSARSENPSSFQPGDIVRVTSRENLTLLISD